MCVQACEFDALTYEEREEEYEEEALKRDEMEIAFESLIKKYGLKQVLQTASRLSKR